MMLHQGPDPGHDLDHDPGQGQEITGLHLGQDPEAVGGMVLVFFFLSKCL